jgi:threonine/homoserine/homoserine lactone efflux protein
MRSMTSYLAFVGTATGAVLMPGPDLFVVLRTALTGGARAAAWAAAGSAVGNLVWGTATVLGATALLTASASAFTALKLAGAVYLVSLGARALLAARRGDLLADEREPAAPSGAGRDFRNGLASDLANVKVGLFWTALVPQFVAAESSALLPVAMVAAMAAIVFTWLTGYAHLAARLSRTLKRRRSSQAVNGTVGAVLVALGSRLALAPH